MNNDRELGQREMLEAVRIIMTMSEEERYKIFNNGDKITIQNVLFHNSPFVILKTLKDNDKELPVFPT